MRQGTTRETVLALDEVREMVAAARRYVNGEIHFSRLAAPTLNCRFWARVFNLHPAIQDLARRWTAWVDQRWNEWGQHPVSLTDKELRTLLANDLGEASPAKSNVTSK